MSLSGNVLSFEGRNGDWNTSADGEAVARQIAEAGSIETLDFSSNSISVDAAKAIAKELTNHPELKRVIFADIVYRRQKNDIPVILKTLFDAIVASGARLTEVDLCRNPLTPYAFEGIAGFLSGEGVFELRVLRLGACYLGRSVLTLSKCLKTAHGLALRKGKTLKLETFEAGSNSMRDIGAIALSKAFSTLTTLQVIDLGINVFSPKGIAALASSFSKNKHLRKIVLHINEFRRNGAIALGKAISDLDYLTVVDVSDCWLGRKGSMEIAFALSKKMGNIQEVNLSGNAIDADTARKIARMMVGLPKLKNLNLENNNFGDEFEALLNEVDLSRVYMGDVVDNNKALTKDSDDEEPYEDYNEYEGVEDEAEENPELTYDPVELSFRGRANRQWNTVADGEAIAKEIRDQHPVHVLELSTNTLGVEATGPIAAALEQHPELKEARFGDIFTGRLNTEIPMILKSLCDSMLTAGARLTYLDLSDNAIGPQAIQGLEGFLSGRGCYALKSLYLNNCGLGGAGVKVAECLIKCRQNAIADNASFNLENFFADRNRLEDAGAKALAEAFQVLGTLVEISMSQNGIRSEGIVALAQGIRQCPNLKSLSLGDNTFKKHATLVMARVVKNLKHLWYLHFADCLIKSEASVALVKALADSKSGIQVLFLSGNEISASAVLEMCKIAERLPQLCMRLNCNALGSRFRSIKEQYKNHVFGNESDDEGSISSEEDSDGDSDGSSGADGDVDSDAAQMLANLSINQPAANAFSTPATSFRMDTSFSTAPTTPIVNPFAHLQRAQPQPAPVPVELSFKGRENRVWNTVADGEAIAKEIRATPAIHTLELSTNTLGVEATGPIAAALSKHPELKTAAWADIFTGRLNTEIPMILKSLCDSMLSAGTRLTVLDLSDNAIGPQAIQGLEGFLSGEGCFALKELRLNNCGLGGAGINVANALVQCHCNATAANTSFNLEVFIAGRNRLENRGANALADAFEILGSLVEVRLPQNGIRAEGIIDLARGIASNKKLRVFTLNDNTCGYKGAMALAQTVRELPELRELDVSDALCRRRGSIAIVQALANSKIEEIKLNGNELDVPSAEEIITIAQHELPALKQMVLHTNCFGEEGYNKLVEECADSRFDFGDEEDDDGERDSDTDDE